MVSEKGGREETGGGTDRIEMIQGSKTYKRKNFYMENTMGGANRLGYFFMKRFQTCFLKFEISCLSCTNEAVRSSLQK